MLSIGIGLEQNSNGNATFWHICRTHRSFHPPYLAANIFSERIKQRGTLREEGSSHAQCSPQSELAIPKQF